MTEDMTQDMRKDTILMTVQRSSGFISTTLRSLLLLVLMTVGVNSVYAAYDYKGFWYINNQRLPDDGYYFVPTINCFYGDDEDQPHLTTFKTGKDKNSIWRIEPVIDGTNTYYRIIHNATGKYLMANTAITALKNAGAAHRKRVHLETLSSFESDLTKDNSLFVFTEIDADNKIIAIKSKNIGSKTNGEGTDHLYLNPRGNGASEFDSYRAADGRAIININGTVGFWGNDNSNQPSIASQPGSCWKLEIATSTCANPVIKYTDASTIQISYPIGDDTGWTIYYTTDGSNPSDNTNTNRTAITSTETISAAGVSKIRAIATKDGWESSDEAVLVASGVIQMVQSKQCDAFYMVPPIADGETYATTSNIPNAAMGWQFVPAGLYCGIQYYNIINSVTNTYLYCNVANGQDNALIMKSSTDISTSEQEQIDRAKFRLIIQDDGSFKIISKWWAAEKPDKYYVNKKNNNNGGNPLNLADGTSNTAQWNVITAPSSPKTQFDASFASTTTSTKCYLIKSSNDPAYHLLPPTAEGGNATANTTGANPKWFLLPVEDNDEWIASYHIKNGKTGEYLYFNGAAGDNNTFFTSSTIESGNENRYKFIIVRSANTAYIDAYNIVPYALKDQANQSNNSLNRSNKTLRTQNSRNTAASLWQFEEVCLDPIFEQSGDNIIISFISNTSDVYYTTDGSDPSTSETKYDNSSWPASEQHYIKAIAKLKNNSSVTSEKVTLLNNPVITSEEGPYPYKGTAWEPEVTDVSITFGTDIISAPTSPATYSVRYTNNTDAGEATIVVNDVAYDTWYILNASKSFTIDRAEVTVKADDQTKVYQETPLVDPTLTATITGLVNNEPESKITYTISREAGEEIGLYTITPAGDPVQGNYNVTYETGVFQIGQEITPAPTVSLANWTYGSPNEPSVSGNSSGGAVTYYYKVKDAGDDTYTVEAPINVGNYTVKAEIARTDEFFPATTAAVDFKINKASLAVVADAITKDYLDEDPELTYTVTGIQYNEDRNTILACELQRESGEAKGDYAITKKSLTLLSTQNYSTPSFTGNTFTITAKTLGDPVTYEPAPKISIYTKDNGNNTWKVSVYTGETAFVEGTDYISEVTGPDSDGNYTVTVTAKEGGNCAGLAKATYSPNTQFYNINGTTEKFIPYISTTSDLTTSSDLVPYIVSYVNSSIGTVSIVPISYIPKDEPVLLLAKSDVTGITTSPKNPATTPISESLINNNKLKIAPDEPSDPDNPESVHGVHVESTEAYMFYNGEFVLTMEGTIKAGKYYLYNPRYHAPANPGAPSPAPARSLAIVKDEATGIIQLTNDEVKEALNDVWYSIDGQKLNKKPIRKGIYIKNGKKLILK